MKKPFLSPTLRCVALLLALGAPSLFGAKLAKTEAKNPDAATSPGETKNAKREEKAARTARGGSDDPANRQLDRVRERMGVSDDTEWAVIAERIHKVEEARRDVAAAASGGKAALVGGEKVKRAARGATQPEFDALRSAVGDQYPDAEIKSRLARVHETYVQRETELRAAEAALRSILSVRQEAVAVMAGLLTP